MVTENERLIRLPEVLNLCGLSRSAVYEMIPKDEFPRPVRIGARSVGRRQSEIQHWMAARPPAMGFLDRATGTSHE